MKMNFLQKSKSKSPIKSRLITSFVVFSVFSILFFLFPNGMKSLFYTISKPVWTSRDFIARSLSYVPGYFTSKTSLQRANLSLEDNLGALNLKLSDYDALQKENEELKSMLGRTNKNKRILSRVLSKPPQSPYDTLVLDAGRDDGISFGDKVYLSQGIIIGIISEVNPHNSIVTLFSSSGQEEEAVLQRTGASFRISGQGGANFIFEAPKDVDVLWGDTFVYSGLSSAILGIVYYIDSNSQSAFKTIHLKIPGNVFDSKWVFIENI